MNSIPLTDAARKAKQKVSASLVKFAIKKILAPTDFSPASSKAAAYAFRFAQNSESELIFLHVLESPASWRPESLPAACAEEIKAGAEENLRSLVQSARTSGATSARSILRKGVPPHEIVEAAKELDVDLLVIATHGLAGWKKHFPIGSTAERVARAARCPVLVVREKEHAVIRRGLA